jgi:hypothetical protein
MQVAGFSLFTPEALYIVFSSLLFQSMEAAGVLQKRPPWHFSFYMWLNLANFVCLISPGSPKKP